MHGKFGGEIIDLECCGIKEYDGIFYSKNTPQHIVNDIAEYRYGEMCKFAFVLFSDVAKRRRINNVCKFIVDNKLGDIVKTKIRENPNSNNRIKVAIWALNQKKLESWYNKNKAKENKNVYDEDENGRGFFC